MNMPTAKDILKTARKTYPHSRNMRHQLVRKTLFLLKNNKHAFQTGGFSIHYGFDMEIK